MIERLFSSCSWQSAQVRRSRLFLFAVGATICSALPAAGQDAGYRSLSFGTTGTSTPSGEKPESKLWWNDGFWWGCLWNDAVRNCRIYRMDPANHSWIDTGTTLDPRNSRADVLWDGATQKLYLTSHLFTTTALTTSSNWGRLFRYSYNAATKTYLKDSGFPVDVTRGDAETLTLARDSTGRLWATWVQDSKVMVNNSLSDDLTWNAPYVLPASSAAVAVTSDDISAVIAFGGNKVGVMWSNQSTATTYFSVHDDAAPASVWQAEESILSGSGCSGACSDDHLNLKADQSGRVYAAVKTSLGDGTNPNPDAPLVMLAVRDVSGTWSAHTFGVVRDHHTRPILQLDEANQELYLFATTSESGGAIYYKSSPMDSVQFPPGLGTPFIRTAGELKTNNATTSKQNPTPASGLLVLASDQDTRFYLQNQLPLLAPPDTPKITSFSPGSGSVGTEVYLEGSMLAGATAVSFNGTAAAFTVVSDTQIITNAR